MDQPKMADRLSVNDYRRLLKEFRIVAREQVMLACEEAERILNREITEGRLSTEQASKVKSLIWTSAERAFEKALSEAEQYVSTKGGSDDH